MHNHDDNIIMLRGHIIIILLLLVHMWTSLLLQHSICFLLNTICLLVSIQAHWELVVLLLAPVARLTAYKTWDISLDCQKISLNHQIDNSFLESVAFQFHTLMLSSEVAQSFKSYGHFSDLKVGIALSHRHVGFFGYNKYINPRPRREDDTASPIDVCIPSSLELCTRYTCPVIWIQIWTYNISTE